MNYDIDQVTARLAEDPAGAVAGWERAYRVQVDRTAEAIAQNRAQSPVVLLAGPSGSSKTTTASRIRESLCARGVPAHLISMDNYYLSREDPLFPKLPDGSPDLEAPECLDTALLEEHFSLLETGGDIYVPIYDFPTHRRLPDRSIRMDASQGDVFIFEGIHALNSRFTAQHPGACRVYVSPEDGFSRGGKSFCSPVLLRLMRRIVRDYQFRGATAAYSLSLWDNVVGSEKRYIFPYQDGAGCRITTTLAYELGVLRGYVLPLVRVMEPSGWSGALREVLEQVPPLSPDMVPGDSILREFIGG